MAAETPFTYVEAINSGRNVPIGKAYNQFIINKAFSYYVDTIAIVEFINQYPNLPNEAHFKFLRAMIKPKKRFSKWPKPTISNEVKAVMEYYRISQHEAEMYITVLSKEQVEHIVDALSAGR